MYVQRDISCTVVVCGEVEDRRLVSGVTATGFSSRGMGMLLWVPQLNKSVLLLCG